VKDVVQEDLRGHCPRGQRRSFCESSPPRPPALTWLHVCVPFGKNGKTGATASPLRGCPACERAPAPGYTTESKCRVDRLEDAAGGVGQDLVSAKKSDVCAHLRPLNELNSYPGMVPVTAPHHHHRDLRNLAPVSLLNTPKTMLPMHTIPSNYCPSGNNWRTGPPFCTLSSNARERDRQRQSPAETERNIHTQRKRATESETDGERQLQSALSLNPINLERCLNPQMPLGRCNLQAPSTPTLSGLRQRQACSTNMKAQGPQV
jgi:hypothetical protein